MIGTIQQGVVILLACLSVLTFFSTLKKVNPYGRYAAADEKHTMASRPGWLLLESPQWWAFTVTYWSTAAALSSPGLVLYVLWQCHYLYRGIIYPLRRNDHTKRFPINTVIFGILFNAVNGFANGYAVGHAEHLMDPAWFADPRFGLGLAIALLGWVINYQADTILINLRSDGFTGYRIPRGGAFHWVSGANYSGEILLWTGWAIMSWTTAGLVFAVFTISNLLPRALSHHQWYLQQFPDYPKERKAVIPWVL